MGKDDVIVEHEVVNFLRGLIRNNSQAFGQPDQLFLRVMLATAFFHHLI